MLGQSNFMTYMFFERLAKKFNDLEFKAVFMKTFVKFAIRDQ